MNRIFQKTAAVLMTGALSLACLGGCAASEQQAPSTTPTAPSAPSALPEEMSGNTYDFPTMGLTATLPDALMARIEQGELAMISNEACEADGTTLQYSLISWSTMAEVPQSTGAEPEMALTAVGALGVYKAGMDSQLDALTGCDEHQELGKSVDGAYQYFLSTSRQADEVLTEEIRQIQVTLTEMAPLPDASVSGASSATTVGEFTTQDVNGNAYTQELFQDYDLTLVNVFTTWCSPCVAEMPDLEKLHQMMAERGVHVVGVVLDVLNEKGEIVPEDLERAQLLVERTGVTYPVLLPDASYLNGRLIGIEAVPETFFVDKDGNIVGGTYSGSGSLEDWIAVVEEELAALQENA